MINKIHQELSAKKYSAVELTKKYLEKIEVTNEALNSFITVTNDLALEQAKKADEMFAHDQAALLTGMPFAVKDNFCLAATRTTAGSRMLADYIAPYTATAVERLLAEGAVPLGKTNMDDSAMGSSSETSAYGPVKNAHDPTRVPGGSSGGSATSVAAEQVVFALGTDTGGSIRQPAAFSGIVGYKPSYGLVSRYGVIAMASSLDTVGPLTSSVEDAEIILEILAGTDPYDSTTGKKYTKKPLDPKTIRIGIAKEYMERLDANSIIKKALEKIVEQLKGRIAEFIPVDLPNSRYAIEAYYVITPSEVSSNLARYDGIRFGTAAPKNLTLAEYYAHVREAGFGAEPKRRIMMGTFALSAGYQDAYYKKAQKIRTLVRKDFQTAFTKCDIILAPATPNTAFTLGAKTHDPLEMYAQDIFTCPMNLAGVPALVMPSGTHESKENNVQLPIGVQLVAGMNNDATLLAFGKYLESILSSSFVGG